MVPAKADGKRLCGHPSDGDQRGPRYKNQPHPSGVTHSIRWLLSSSFRSKAPPVSPGWAGGGAFRSASWRAASEGDSKTSSGYVESSSWRTPSWQERAGSEVGPLQAPGPAETPPPRPPYPGKEGGVQLIRELPRVLLQEAGWGEAAPLGGLKAAVSPRTTLREGEEGRGGCRQLLVNRTALDPAAERAPLPPSAALWMCTGHKGLNSLRGTPSCPGGQRQRRGVPTEGGRQEMKRRFRSPSGDCPLPPRASPWLSRSNSPTRLSAGATGGP